MPKEIMSSYKITAIGFGYGGWNIPTDTNLAYDSICYCIGAGEDISFDVDLVEKYHAKVHIFDPTPRAIKHFELLNTNTLAGKSTSINNSDENYTIDKLSLKNLFFHPWGIWNTNSMQKFFAPRKSNYVSHSIHNNGNTQEFFVAECLTIHSSMKKLKHTHIDLLKIDAEGAEHEILRSMLTDNIKPHILCIEFDRYEKPSLVIRLKIHKTAWLLRKAGYKKVWQDGANFTFIKSL